jgi:cell division protein FtsB
MSARVNLLPRELEERRRNRRRMALLGLGLLLYVLVLGGVYALKVGDVNRVRDERDAAQAEVARLEAEVAGLRHFRELADELEARNAVLTAAMEDEIGWARVLNDLSLAFPGTSSLQTLAALAQDREVATGDIDFGPAVGSMTFTGYSIERYAPGVEAVLIEFDKVRAFFHPFLSGASRGDIGETEVTTFNGSVQLDEEAYTRRYEDGLPPEALR